MRTLMIVSSLAIIIPTIIIVAQQYLNSKHKHSPARHELKALAFFLLFGSIISIVGLLTGLNGIENVKLFRYYTVVEWLFLQSLLMYYHGIKDFRFYLLASFLPLIAYTLPVTETVFIKVECFFLMLLSIKILVRIIISSLSFTREISFWIALSVVIYSLNYVMLSDGYTDASMIMFSVLNIFSIFILTTGIIRWITLRAF